MRGIETRRHDTPPLVAKTQLEILQLLVSSDHLTDALPKIQALLRQKVNALRVGSFQLGEFVVRQTLSRTSNQYRGTSSAAEAVRQLEAAGKSLRPGQTARFVYTMGHPRVRAWDLPSALDPRSLDTHRYVDLLLRAAETILTPIGFSLKELDEWVFDNMCSLFRFR